MSEPSSPVASPGRAPALVGRGAIEPEAIRPGERQRGGRLDLSRDVAPSSPLHRSSNRRIDAAVVDRSRQRETELHRRASTRVVGRGARARRLLCVGRPRPSRPSDLAGAHATAGDPSPTPRRHRSRPRDARRRRRARGPPGARTRPRSSPASMCCASGALLVAASSQWYDSSSGSEGRARVQRHGDAAMHARDAASAGSMRHVAHRGCAKGSTSCEYLRTPRASRRGSDDWRAAIDHDRREDRARRGGEHREVGRRLSECRGAIQASADHPVDPPELVSRSSPASASSAHPTARFLQGAHQLHQVQTGCPPRSGSRVRHRREHGRRPASSSRRMWSAPKASVSSRTSRRPGAPPSLHDVVVRTLLVGAGSSRPAGSRRRGADSRCDPPPPGCSGRPSAGPRAPRPPGRLRRSAQDEVQRLQGPQAKGLGESTANSGRSSPRSAASGGTASAASAADRPARVDDRSGAGAAAPRLHRPAGPRTACEGS